jgi:hypothetical protein
MAIVGTCIGCFSVSATFAVNGCCAAIALIVAVRWPILRALARWI